MKFNESQISRMIEKIRKTEDNVRFKLNKSDVTPIEVFLVRTPHSITMMDAAVAKPIFSVFGYHDNASCLRKFVEEMIDCINNWDLVIKQHFIALSIKEGYEP